MIGELMKFLTVPKFILAASCWLIVLGTVTSSTSAQVQEPVAGVESDELSQAELSQAELSQAESLQAEKAQSPPDEPKVPERLESYMGRRIAQTMHYEGAEWLIRDVREQEERCSLMLANLGIKRGMVVCDMGCGNGFYSLPMAQLTGNKGYVVGVDVQPEMLSMLRERMEEQGIENVIPILGSFHNPRLPRELIDIILLVDVYHEFSHPVQMLDAMRASLKPDGLIVLVEYRAEDPEVPIKRLHKMSKKQIHKEMNANGFEMAKEFDKLPWQHMMFFGKTKLEQKNETAPTNEPDSTGELESKNESQSTTPSKDKKP
jgi:ubiquinone/menaquinone biosynthesis C-methylase UbiE